MNRSLLSIIILLSTAPIIEAQVSNMQIYSDKVSISHDDLSSADSEIITKNYLRIAVERLKNIEEILLRLSNSLEIGDDSKAKLNYIKAHYEYESIRPLILLFPNIDEQLHSHKPTLINDPSNAHFTGFHAVEYALFKQSDIAQAFVETQKLLSQIRLVIAYTQAQNITFQELLNLLPVFAQQIIEHKIPGNENIYSGADLGDIVANLEGINLILNQIKEFIPTSTMHPIELCEENIVNILYDYKDGDYYMPHNRLTSSDKTLLHNEATHLSILLNNFSFMVTQKLSQKKQQRFTEI